MAECKVEDGEEGTKWIQIGRFQITWWPEDDAPERVYVTDHEAPDTDFYVYADGRIGGIVDGRREWEVRSSDDVIDAIQIQEAVRLLNSVK